MKRIPIFLMRCACAVLLCLVSGAYAQDGEVNYDARFVIQYPVSKSDVLVSYRNNYYAIEELKRFFSTVEISMIDSISIVGSSSPEGDGVNNFRLASKRAVSLRDFIHTNFPFVGLDMMYLSSKSDTWSDMLRMIRQDPDFPDKDHALIVLAAEQSQETRIRLVKLLEYDESYDYLRINILPQLRNSTTFVISYRSDRPFVVHDTRSTFDQRFEFIEKPVDRHKVDTLMSTLLTAGVAAPNTFPGLMAVPDRAAARQEPVAEPVFTSIRIRKPVLALKTNLLFDVATLANIGLELPIGERFSIGAEVIFPWWLNEERQNSLQVLNVNLEAKYWFKSRFGKSKGLLPCMTGWFMGVHVGAGYYDLEYQGKGYQGESFLLAGLTGGFAHSIGRKLRMEYSLGVGYMETNYRKYEARMMSNDRWELVKREAGVFSWLGPTQAKVSLVWLLNRNYMKKGGAR